MKKLLPPNLTPEQWIEWFESQSLEDKITTVRAIAKCSYEAWVCKSEAHVRYLRECRENHQ